MPPDTPCRRPPLLRALAGFIPALVVAMIAAIGSHPLVLVPLIAANALSMAAVCHAIGFGPELSLTRTALRRGAAYLVMFTAYTVLVLALVAWPLLVMARAPSLGAALVLSVALAIGVAVLWRVWPAFGLLYVWNDAFTQSPRHSRIFTGIARSLAFARHLSAQERFFDHFLPAACSLLLMAFGALALTGLYGILPAEMRTAGVLLYAVVVLPVGALVLANRTLHAMLHENSAAPARGGAPADDADGAAEADAQAPLLTDIEPADDAAIEARNRAFLEAVRGARIERALQLLEAGADPDTAARPEDRDQRPAVMLAALLPDTRLLRALIASGADINAAHGGLTPLLAATRDSYHGRAEAVMMLLANGADAATADAQGNTPLHGAALSAEPGVAAMLLDAGAPIDAINRNGMSPMAVAARAGNWSLVDFLLDHRATVNPVKGEPALVAAAAGQHDDAEGVQLMLRHKARINAVNALGRTALICASLEGHESVVRALLKAGADADHGDRNHSTALMEAARAGADAIVQLLVDAGADVNRRDTYGRNALILACQSPRAGVETIRALLAGGADPYVQAQDERSALDHAAAAGRWDLITLMNPDAPAPASLEDAADDAVEHEADTPAAQDGMQSLLDALRARRWGDVASHRDSPRQAPQEQRADLYLALADDADAMGARQWLLDQRLEPEAHTSAGERLTDTLLDGLPQTAMAASQWFNAGADPAGAGLLATAASRAGNDAASIALCVQMLAAGADPFGGDAQQRTPLHHAAAHGQQALLDALLDLGAYPDSRDACGDTPLHAALRNGTPRLPVVKSLLAHGADPEAATTQGETPLGLALALDHGELQDWLQWHGAWALPGRRLRDADLPVAAARGDVDAVRRLLALDMPVESVDAQGVSALIRACGGGHREVVACLLDAGADLNAATHSGITALAAAVNARRDAVVALLLERGADADQGVGDQTRVLALAAAHGYPDIVERLLVAGADVNASDASHYGALHAAAQFCFSSNDSLRARRLLDVLLKHDADVNAATDHGQTPLLLLLGAHAAPGTACDATHIGALLPVLLDAGAALDHADTRGVTPLHACAMHALLAPIRVLLSRGADRTARDRLERTAADVARRLGYVDVAVELGARSVPSVRQTLRRPALPDD